jgi:hypothetical protein
MKMKQILHSCLAAEFEQFYVQDGYSDDYPCWLREEETRRLLALTPGIIAVGTNTESFVAVTLEIAEQEPENNDFDDWDQVNECTLNVQSGRIVVTSISDFTDQRGLDVSAGVYRARIYYGQLGVPFAEHYKIVLWKAPPGPLEVLKWDLRIRSRKQLGQHLFRKA